MVIDLKHLTYLVEFLLTGYWPPKEFLFDNRSNSKNKTKILFIIVLNYNYMYIHFTNFICGIALYQVWYKKIIYLSSNLIKNCKRHNKEKFRLKFYSNQIIFFLGGGGSWWGQNYLALKKVFWVIFQFLSKFNNKFHANNLKNIFFLCQINWLI